MLLNPRHLTDREDMARVREAQLAQLDMLIGIISARLLDTSSRGCPRWTSGLEQMLFQVRCEVEQIACSLRDLPAITIQPELTEDHTRPEDT